MSAFRKAAVYVRDRLAGTLSETDSGYRFAYDGAYLALPDAGAVTLARGGFVWRLHEYK